MSALLADNPWVPFSGSTTDGGQGWVDHTWPGRTWSVGSHLVRYAVPDRTAVIAAELARLAWLRTQFGGRPECPEPVIAADGWLVIERPEAAPGHQPEAQSEPDGVPSALGQTLRRLHDLDTEPCPFARSWTDLVDELSGAVDAGRLRTERLPEPYRRYELGRLLELINEGRPSEEEPVVAHGSPILSNLFLARGEPASMIGVHRLGLADRHVDLAVITRQLQAAFGPEAAFGFYEGYGRDPDLVRLDHYVLIDAMRAAIDIRPDRT